MISHTCIVLSSDSNTNLLLLGENTILLTRLEYLLNIYITYPIMISYTYIVLFFDSNTSLFLLSKNTIL